VDIQGNGANNNALVDIGFPNKIRLSSIHTGFSNNSTTQSEISSDTNTYKTLMIVGNRSANLKDKNGVVMRRVSVWDRLEVAEGARANGIAIGQPGSWLTDPTKEGVKYDYECISTDNAAYNLRLVSNNGVFVHAPGGLNVAGPIVATTISTTTKAFRISHPEAPEERDLVHGCLEGPENGVYYRGEAQLVDGVARIELPSYFEALTRKEGRTVQLTPIWDGPCSQLAAARVAGGSFVVHGVDRTNPCQAFYWEVKAVRADVAPLKTDVAKGEAVR
jgi:hypothetical protein